MSLYANVLGEGPPFIILHGFLGMGDNWKTLGKYFAGQAFQVHLVDQRNHGRSFHDPSFNYEAMTQDLLGYCEKQGVKQMVLLGHSMGGKTAMYFAAQYPELVKKLVVVDIAPRAYPAHHGHILDALLNLKEQLPSLKKRSEASEFLSSFIQDQGIAQFLLKNLYWSEPGVLGLRVNLETIVQHAHRVGDALPEDCKFYGDTLFLKGENSDYIQSYDFDMINKIFVKAIIKTINNAGHWIHAQNPKDFAAAVMHFL